MEKTILKSLIQQGSRLHGIILIDILWILVVEFGVGCLRSGFLRVQLLSGHLWLYMALIYLLVRCKRAQVFQLRLIKDACFTTTKNSKKYALFVPILFENGGRMFLASKYHKKCVYSPIQ